MNRQKIFFRKFISSEAILVTYHHQFIVQFCCNFLHISKCKWIKFKLFPGVNLVSWGIFFYQCTIPVYKQYFLHSYFVLALMDFTSAGVTILALLPKLLRT